MKPGTMKVKMKQGKIDKQSLEQQIKRKIPGFDDYEFDYDKDKLWVKARKEGMPEGIVELFLFWFYK